MAVAGGSGWDMDAELRPGGSTHPTGETSQRGGSPHKRYENRQGKGSWSVGRLGFFLCDLQIIIKSRHDLMGGQSVKVSRALHSCDALLSSS